MNILFINLLKIFIEAFNKLRLIKKKIDDIITFIFVFMKTRYNAKYLIIIFK